MTDLARHCRNANYLMRIFYRIKPAVPRSVQLSVRRKRASIQRKKFSDIWPIDSDAAKKPNGWNGWPGGRRFALVLTHDVDSVKGYAKVRHLMECETQMGLRSCFNFVAEGYEISDSMRDDVERNGFEIGVHGLTHDGLLFAGTSEEFRRRAAKINAYLEKWHAVGFRAPTMRHNFCRLMHLNIEYDASCFDTDPFEPDTDGVGTIFPFLVGLPQDSDAPICGQRSSSWPVRLDYDYPGSAGLDRNEVPRRSFVELPYTLPQDHCLFVILQERTIRIWKEKLDWIAENGGMALLNAHPDYMNFSGNALGPEEYPADMYREFLSYVMDRYADDYWLALPREVATFWSRNVPRRKGKPEHEGIDETRR